MTTHSVPGNNFEVCYTNDLQLYMTRWYVF